MKCVLLIVKLMQYNCNFVLRPLPPPVFDDLWHVKTVNVYLSEQRLGVV